MPIRELAKILFNKSLIIPELHLVSINNLKSVWLDNKKISCLIFDIDQTLSLQDESEIYISVLGHFLKLKETYKTCLLSNPKNYDKKALKRFDILEEKYNVKIIRAEKKKPHSDGFIRAINYLKCAPKDAAMVGDRIFTDILGANLCGIHTILVDPIREKDTSVFISIPRMLERVIFKSLVGR